MKVSKELANILNEAYKEVNAWPKWQQSLDPQNSGTAASEQPSAELDTQVGCDSRKAAA